MKLFLKSLAVAVLVPNKLKFCQCLDPFYKYVFECSKGIGSREWKQKIQKIWTRNDILKTDSTLAVRGSESEINIRLFTESEIKMVEQPFKESTESMYSNCLGTNDVLDSELSNMSGDDCKKSQFDVIYEEK